MNTQFSLTNYIEFITVNSLCDNATNRNQFNTIPFKRIRIREEAIKFNISPSYYTARIITDITIDKIKTKIVSFNDTLQLFGIYFFIRNTEACNSDINLSKRLADIYNLHYGAEKISSVYFPEEVIKFQTIMPSRGKTFR